MRVTVLCALDELNQAATGTGVMSGILHLVYLLNL